MNSLRTSKMLIALMALCLAATTSSLSGQAQSEGDRNGVGSRKDGKRLSVNAFKIPSLWGVRDTAPYFHDNSAKTLEDAARHYDRFFATVFGIPTDGQPPFFLTAQEQADIVAYLKLLK